MRPGIRFLCVLSPLVLLALAGSAIPKPPGRPPYQPPMRPKPYIPPRIKPAITMKAGLPRGPLGTPRSPLVAEMHLLSRANPAEALGRVGKPGSVLSPTEHAVLVRQSLNRLAALDSAHPSPYASKELWRTVVKTRKLDREHFTPDQHAQVDAVAERLEAQLVRSGLAKVLGLVERKQWGQASIAAGEWLDRDHELAREGVGGSKAHAELRAIFQNIRTANKDQERLARLEALWRPDEPATWPAFQKECRDLFPEAKLRAVDGLIAAAELQPHLSDPWKSAIEPARVLTMVQRLRRALAGSKDPREIALSDHVQQELAMRAFLAGDIAAARALWPADGARAHAALLLGDLRALLTGKGETNTEAGRDAATSSGGKGKPPRPPVGLRPLFPDGPEPGWKPPKQKDPRDEDAIGETVTRMKERLAESVTAEFEHQRTEGGAHFAPHVTALHGMRDQIQARAIAENNFVDQASKNLGSPLQPAERAFILLNLDADVDTVVKKVKERRKRADIEGQIELLRAYLDDGIQVGVLEVMPWDSPNGMVLENLHPQGQLSKAGFQSGDIVLELDGRKIADADAFALAIAYHYKPGDTVAVKVRRGNDDFALRAPLIGTETVYQRKPNYHYPADEVVLSGARGRLERGEDLVEIVASLAHVLRSDVRDAQGGIRIGVAIDLIALALHSDLEAVEQFLARDMLEKGAARTKVIARIRELRQVERRKHDLERVKGYLERPLAEDELRKVRGLIEAGNAVADVVAEVPEALGPAWPRGAKHIAEVVHLDEIADEMAPAPDAFEMDRARQLLREGRKVEDVVAMLELRRAEAFEALVQRRFKIIENVDPVFAHRELALEYLRQGRMPMEVLRLLGVRIQ